MKEYSKSNSAMKRSIAICGLDCEKCDAPILPEHINCDGCRMDGRKTVFCDRLCQIRQCALSKGFETCGDCPEKESCHKVGAIWQHNPQAKENLEG